MFIKYLENVLRKIHKKPKKIQKKVVDRTEFLGYSIAHEAKAL